jgi:hypothetical protein
MTVGELRDFISGQDDDRPVVMWNDDNGQHGDVEYLTFTDGQVTICGVLR